MRAFYEQWWARTEPLARDFQPIHLGSEKAPETVLSAHNWVAPNTAGMTRDILAGVKHNGPWHVLVERAGRYEISLRRWPVEAALPITAAAPPYKGNLANYPAGKALPIAKARLKIAGVDDSMPVTGGEEAVVFSVTLPAGRTTLQTWFYNAAGKELCGAYYVYVRRMK